MRIIQLTAENVKRLKAVDITPKGDLVQVTGKNGSGKTSVLDAIWWALGGEDAVQKVPIRRGETAARIRLDLGDMIVERTFSEEGTTKLTVRNAAGAVPGTPDKRMVKFQSPQELLDELVGRLSFDPLEFANKPTRAQYDDIRALVKLDVDIDLVDAQNAEDFIRRSAVNRDAKAKRAQAEAIPVVPGLPDDRIDENALLAELQEVANHNAQIELRIDRRKAAEEKIAALKQKVVGKRAQAAQEEEAGAATVRKKEAEKEEAIRKMVADIEAEKEFTRRVIADLIAGAGDSLVEAENLENRLAAAEPLPAPIDAAAVRTKIEDARQTNEHIRQAKTRQSMLLEALDLERKSDALTEQMDKRKEAADAALAAAQMPVEGLSLGRGGVLYNGLPFEQASDAERLRVSVAVAMAANPKLRVLRIKDGSLLDDDAVKMLEVLAHDKDYQVWVERVDSTGKVGIVMDAGEVVADHQEA